MMTGLWSVIVPATADVTNLVTNPSAETATTGYGAKSGGTLAASTAKSRRGYKSLSYTSTTNTTDGILYDAVALTSGTTYTAAFDFWGADGIPFTAYFATTGGTAVDDAITWTGSAQWERKVVTHSASGSANFRLYVTKNSSESAAAFYVDGVGIYAAAYDPQHVDGDQPDCHWNGTPHASTSYRDANSVEGGQAVNFDDYGFYLSDFSGAGMVEIDPFSQPYTLLPGSEDAGERIIERQFSLVGEIIGTSLADLHSKRKALTSLFKPGRQLWLVYSGGNSTRPTRIMAKYIRGLSMGPMQGYAERVALQFQATDPFWYENGQEGAGLLSTASDSDANYAIKRIDGVWSAVNSVFNGEVYAIERGADGAIYYGGNFTGLTGSTTGDYIAKFSTISSTAPITVDNGTNGVVRTIQLAPNGDLYIGGDFTAAGGRANTPRIARYDGTQYQALSTGIGSGVVYTISISPTGIVYIGGSFVNHGDANGDYITSWNGTAFASLGTGANGEVLCSGFGPDGCLYIGGTFTTMNGVTVNGIAKYDGATWTALGSGLDGMGGTNYVRTLAFDKAGHLYIAGIFTAVSGVTCSNIAKWNGGGWEPLGDGIEIDGIIHFSDENLLYASSYEVGVRAFTGLWNGSTWTEFPVLLPSIQYVYGFFTSTDDLIFGFGTSGTATFSAVNTLTNTGTADAYPVITIACSTMASSDTATVEYLRNETTGDTIWLNYPLLDGETLTLDFRPGHRGVTSSFRGNVIGSALLRNSDFAKFRLIPGANSVSLFVPLSASGTITAGAFWYVSHLSFDGSAS